MGASANAWKVLYGLISLATKLLSFAIALLLNRTSLTDLIDLAIGSIFLSTTFVHIMPRADVQIHSSYPFGSLVTITVFAALTLFCFTRDAIAMRDENILTSCETISPQSVMGTELVSECTVVPSPQRSFVISDEFPTLFLYVCVLVNAAAASLWLSALHLADLHHRTGVAIAIQFIEFIAVGTFVARMPISRRVF
jgi:hypothetical protein